MRTMKAGWTAAGLLAFAALLPGCEGMSGTEKGAIIGGLAGAGLGRGIGHHNGHEAVAGWAGAGIGAVVGGLFGALDDEKRGPGHTAAPVDFDEPAPRYAPAPRRVVRTRTIYEEDLPPIPPPTRVVRRTTTTTVVRTVEPPTVVERVIYVDE